MSLREKAVGLVRRAGRPIGVVALRASLRRPHVRAVNYHGVSTEHDADFNRQLAAFRRWGYEDCGPQDLAAFLEGRAAGAAHHRILLTFDDGLRSHYEVVAPALERHGYRGWFFVPSEALLLPESEHAAFATRGQILEDPPAGSLFMSAAEAADLARRGHVVGCHTASHRRLSAAVQAPELEHEVRSARRQLAASIEAEVETFAWVGGEEASYSKAAGAVIRDEGFRFVFLTNHLMIQPGSDPQLLERTHLEGDLPIAEVALRMSRLLDLRYAPKRRRVRRLLTDD